MEESAHSPVIPCGGRSQVRSIPYAGALAGVAGTLLLFWGVISAYPARVLWADNFDTVLILWIMEWGKFALTSDASFWDANSFFPHRHSLVYSDSLLGMQVFFTPLRMLGLDPVLSAYCSFAGICMAGALLTDIALCRSGEFSFPERLLITFSAHFSLCVIGFFYHYQLFGFQLAPPFLLFLYLFLTRFRAFDLLCCTVCGVWGIAIATYLAPMFVAVTVLMAVPLGLVGVCRTPVRDIVRRIGIAAPLAVLALLAALWMLQLRPYYRFRAQAEPQRFEETRQYSARLYSILEPEVRSSKWYEDKAVEYGDWERGMFPGVTLLSGAAIFFLVPFVSFWSARRRAVAADSSLPVYAAGLFTVVILLSFGPIDAQGRWLPFAYLANAVPGLESIRAPGRFAMFLGLPLGLFAAFGCRLIACGRSHVLAGIVCILVAVESVLTPPTFPLPPEPVEVLQELQTVVTPADSLVVLPVAGSDHYHTLRQVMAQLWQSRYHWARLVVGYGARTTSELDDLIQRDNSLRADGNLSPVVDFMKKLQIRFFMIDVGQYPEAVQEPIRSGLDALKASGVKERLIRGTVQVLEMPAAEGEDYLKE